MSRIEIMDYSDSQFEVARVYCPTMGLQGRSKQNKYLSVWNWEVGDSSSFKTGCIKMSYLLWKFKFQLLIIS